ncbi:hypothetical protein LTR36_002732 [Oleoguttula mirabilis]|uniref:Uncharacterized protein n=1 Tax=Oleoguttula mirabilis TaxID=1507867 RepID=A0AAV9JLB6_9PEZI|nr:hypothetical protein LTR36_002732 [Oleoguttula mirabilis]
MLLNATRQTPVHRLEHSLPDDLEKKVPDELVMLILEHMMMQSRQPVRIQTTRSTSRDDVVEDPSLEECSQCFRGCQVSECLVAMARQAYFRVNTIRIDAPTERSPRQILRSDKFAMPWASGIYSLELVLTLTADRSIRPRYATGTTEPLLRRRTVLEQRDITRVVALLGYLKQAFPRLRRLTLMLTIVLPDPDGSIFCCWHGKHAMQRRRGSNSGRLCCVLAESDSSFRDAYLEKFVPVLRAMDLNFAAFKWRTSCGHVYCKEWYGEDQEVSGELVRLVKGDEHSAAVLKDRKMPGWA